MEVTDSLRIHKDAQNMEGWSLNPVLRIAGVFFGSLKWLQAFEGP